MVITPNWANVRIRITDDGKGLRRDAILSAAGKRGIAVPPDADDAAIYQLVFEPGFSTAAQATDISGRGVGMDVVKKNIEKLNGTVSIASKEDAGTAISLTIPLTLAIIDGFMTEVCGKYYIFNLSSVKECIAFEESNAASEINGLIRIRENYIPYVNMRKIFGINGAPCSYPQIVVTEQEGNAVGFLVDRVIGHCQTVIKPLGKGIRDAAMFSGAAILGDGSIALILDLARIIEKAELKEIDDAGKSVLYKEEL
ncbi:MAG: chemotaxis protein CheA [Spirochaetota bacterium]